MLDQALDAAKTYGEREELAALEEAARRAQAAFDHRAHHAAIPVLHLLRGEEVLRMARKAGIDHALDLRLPLEPCRDVHGIAAMSLHAQRQCLDAAQREESVERARHAAHRVLQER